MLKLATVIAATIIAVSVPYGAANAETRMQICGKEWKEHKAQGNKPAKGEGRAAWNAYRAECFTRYPQKGEQKTADKK